MLNQCLKSLIDGKHLSEKQATELALELVQPNQPQALVGALLGTLKAKRETPEEIAGFVRGLKSVAVKIPTDGRPVYDVAGTGGDGAHTVNISTLTAFVLAGAGLRIAKHGNRSVSSRCGSADVLHQLGVNIHAAPENIGMQIRDAGIGFIYAPLAHPAMKNVMDARKSLGMPTVFNLAGPLSNPMDLTGQMIGVYSPALLEPVAQVLMTLGISSGVVLHGHGGLDEATLSGHNELLFIRGGQCNRVFLDASDLGLSAAPVSALKGGSIGENADMFLSILGGQKGPCTDTVLLNSAIALMAFGKAEDFVDALEIARESLDDGHALKALRRVIEISNSTGGVPCS